MKDSRPVLSAQNLQALCLQAARLCLDKLTTSDIELLVSKLMDDGLYSDEFINVIYPARSLTMDEAGELLQKIMQQFEVPLPDKEESMRIIIADYMQKILSNPQNSASLFGEFLHAFLMGNENKMPDPIIEEMTNCYYNYDQMNDIEEAVLNPWPSNWVQLPLQFQYKGKEGMEAVELQKIEINNEMISLAKKWLQST